MPQRPLILGGAGLLACALACAQPLPPGVAGPARGAEGPGGGLATRAVTQYLGLERQLAEALAAHDAQAAMALLDPGFDASDAGAPDVIDRESWLRAAQAHRPDHVRSLAVREAGGLVLVSFLLDRGQGRARRTEFIVDAWQDGRLLSRFSARAAGIAPPPARPDGRE